MFSFLHHIFKKRSNACSKRFDNYFALLWKFKIRYSISSLIKVRFGFTLIGLVHTQPVRYNRNFGIYSKAGTFRVPFFVFFLSGSLLFFKRKRKLQRTLYNQAMVCKRLIIWIYDHKIWMEAKKQICFWNLFFFHLATRKNLEFPVFLFDC